MIKETLSVKRNKILEIVQTIRKDKDAEKLALMAMESVRCFERTLECTAGPKLIHVIPFGF